MSESIWDREARFEEATDRLYAAFESYPLKAEIAMCPCCHLPEDELNLHAKPLRELTDKDLWDYSVDALLVWGDVEDFKHFLPRLLELAVELPYSDLPLPEVVIKKLPYADWQDWPEDEKSSINCFLLAAWELALVEDDDFYDADFLLCSISQAIDDLSPYLEAWESSGIVRLKQLADLITRKVEFSQGRYRLRSLFWLDDESPRYDDRVEQMTQVIEWLRKPSTMEVLEKACQENPGHPFVESISQGVEFLRSMNVSR